MKPQISFVIPCRNEEGNVKLIYSELTTELAKIDKSFELIFIDDGSSDQTALEIADIKRADKRVEFIKLRGQFGKAIALKVGFEVAKGDIVFTMDADLQDNPAEVARFLKKFDEGYDMVIGWKKVRRDPLTKIVSSWLFNKYVSWVTHTKFHDINCGFKAYRREVLDKVQFGQLFRYIAVLAARQNFKVVEIPIDHRPRKFGKSKFGFERSVESFSDINTVFFLTSFAQKPGLLFGTIGLGMGFVGVLIGLYITYLRIMTGGIEYRYPLLFLGVLLMVVGVQFISTGLLAEMIHFEEDKFNKERYV